MLTISERHAESIDYRQHEFNSKRLRLVVAEHCRYEEFYANAVFHRDIIVEWKFQCVGKSITVIDGFTVFNA